MSRSYREPVYVDSYGSNYKKFAKKFANRRVRKAKDVPNGRAYRKVYDSWDIVDWRYRWDGRKTYYYWGGEMRVSEPEPKWRIARK